jgi:hypothetical protein
LPFSRPYADADRHAFKAAGKAGRANLPTLSYVSLTLIIRLA